MEKDHERREAGEGFGRTAVGRGGKQCAGSAKMRDAGAQVGGNQAQRSGLLQ